MKYLTEKEMEFLQFLIFDTFISQNRNLPIVEMKVVLNASSENLNKTLVFPTPESPINNNLNK